MNQSVTSLKLILAGNHQCGKTLFMLKWKDPECQSVTQTTVATALTCQTVTLNNIVYKIQMWDTAGQEEYHSITAPYFRSSQGVFLVFDVTNRASFDSLDYWLNLIHENTHEMPLVVIIANKIDMNDHAVDPEEIQKFGKDHQLTVFMVSAWTGENVQNAVNYMIQTLAQANHSVNESDTVMLSSRKQNSKDQSCC